MRRFIEYLTIGLVALNAVLSCAKSEEKLTDRNEDVIRSISFFVPDLVNDGSETKTVLTGTAFTWAATDTVGIYPNKGSQIFFAMTDGAGTNTAVFDGGGWAFRGGATYYSYYPFIADFYLDRTRIPVHFDGQFQKGPNDFSHFGEYDYLYTGPTEENGGAISFTYKHLICVMKFVATLPAGTYKQLTVTAPSPVFVKKGHFSLLDETPAVKGDEFTKELSIALNDITVNGTESVEINLVSAPFDLTGKSMIISVIDSQKKQFDYVKEMTKAYVPFKIYNIACSNWTEVPQSVGIVIDDWGDGGHISGGAE